MYPRSFGATAINPALMINPAIMAAFAPSDPRVAQCAQQGGTWDAGSQQCAVGGVPTWAYVAGGVAVLGAAWFFLLR